LCEFEAVNVKRPTLQLVNINLEFISVTNLSWKQQYDDSVQTTSLVHAHDAKKTASPHKQGTLQIPILYQLMNMLMARNNSNIPPDGVTRAMAFDPSYGRLLQQQLGHRELLSTKRFRKPIVFYDTSPLSGSTIAILVLIVVLIMVMIMLVLYSK
jgi:hypothetical protein